MVYSATSHCIVEPFTPLPLPFTIDRLPELIVLLASVEAVIPVVMAG